MDRNDKDYNAHGGLTTNELLVIFAALLLMAIVYAYFFHYEYFALLWKIKRHTELFVLQFIPLSVQEWSGLRFSEVKAFLDVTPSSEIKRETVAYIDSTYFNWLRYLPAIFIFFLAYKSFRFRSNLSGGSNPEQYLKDITSSNPDAAHSAPYVAYNPTKSEIYYDPQKSPEGNASAMSLQVHEYVTLTPPVGVPNSPRPICRGRKWEDIDLDIAEKSLGSQLGGSSGVFRGWKHLNELEMRIFKDCYAALPKLERQRMVKVLESRHHYKRTFLRGMIEMAWRYKVHPALLYRYELKKQDRILYFTLNAAVSGNCVIECAGVISHYQMEKAIGKKIPEPMIDLALSKLKEAIQDMGEGVHENELDPQVAKEIRERA